MRGLRFYGGAVKEFAILVVIGAVSVFAVMAGAWIVVYLATGIAVDVTPVIPWM